MPSRVIIVLKALFQLGSMPMALYVLYKLGLKTGYYKRTAKIDARTSKVELSNIATLFALPAREQLLRIIGPDGKLALLKEADEIIAGKVRLFGRDPVELKLTFNKPLAHWTDYETGKASTLDLQPSTFDIKQIWEPARFGWAFTLGRAYHLTQDEKYAESFWKYFEIFTGHNPPNLGPHWMNGQEVALRLMALVWADHVFAASPASGPARRAQLAGSVAHHAARIPPTLIYARSQNNNHLVTEAAALYTAGLALGQSKWRALGWRWLNWALRHQISGYGEYIQHSANYHRLLLQTALWVNTIRSADFAKHPLGSNPQNQWPHASAQALTRATHWLFSMLDPVSGRTPNLGGNDGSYIFPFSICPFGDFRPVLQAAARAFLKTQMSAGMWDEMSAWFGGAPVQVTHEPDHYLIDNLRAKNSWAYLRASRFRSRLAHMDQLHLDLWWRGLNIARDAGTYLYNAEPPWDNPLVSTRVHNTVTVDGRDQMTRAGRFRVLDWVDAYSRNLFEADDKVLQRVLAYHKGYRKLGVDYKRVVSVMTDETWIVADDLQVKRPGKLHTFRLHWLLPDWEWNMEQKDRGITLRMKSPHGPVKLLSMVESVSLDFSFQITLARAGELISGGGTVLPYEGWASPAYGIKVPALSLAINVSSDRNVLFMSQFSFPEKP